MNLMISFDWIGPGDHNIYVCAFDLAVLIGPS